MSAEHHPSDRAQSVKHLAEASKERGAELGSTTDFASFEELRQLQDRFQIFGELGIPDPYFQVQEAVVNSHTFIHGKELISYSSYNYLGLNGDPRVVAAAKDAIEHFGTSVCASRLVSGERPFHGKLEKTIAELYDVEAAIVMVGGHATNVTTIGHLLGPQDLIVYDSLCHNSICMGAQLSGARRKCFPHQNLAALESILERIRDKYRRLLIVVEGVYSMDGDIAPLPTLVELKKKHHCLLMVDEAHSIGVLGKTGRGIREHFGVDPTDVDIWMGTLSKAYASCGGYIAGSETLINYLKYTAPGFVFSVGIPPASAAAALEALNISRQEPQRVKRVQRNADHFLKLAKEAGLETGSSQGSPVIPVITGNSVHALLLANGLFQAGINVQPIVAPAVSEKGSRLRFFITSEHTSEEIAYTVAQAAKILEQIRQSYPDK